MEFVAKVDDIIMLEDELNYRVLKTIELDGVGYVVLQKFDVDLKSILNADEQKQIVVKEIIDENDDYFLQIVTDEEILQKIEEITNNDEE